MRGAFAAEPGIAGVVPAIPAQHEEKLFFFGGEGEGHGVKIKKRAFPIDAGKALFLLSNSRGPLLPTWPTLIEAGKYYYWAEEAAFLEKPFFSFLDSRASSSPLRSDMIGVATKIEE